MIISYEDTICTNIFTMMSNRVYHPGELAVIFMINLINQILNISRENIM